MAKDKLLRSIHTENVLKANRTRDRGFNQTLESFFAGIPLDEILKKDAMILELGCGNGETGRYLAYKYGVQAYGVDLSDFTKIRSENKHPLRIRIKKKIYDLLGKESLIFSKGDIENLPYDDNTFDFAFSYYAFPYLWDKLKGIQETHRILKKGGLAVIDFGLVKEGEWRFNPAKATVPDINTILAHYPNQNQMAYENVAVRDGSAPIIVSHQRLTIRKTSESPLIFPKRKMTFVPLEEALETECHYVCK